MTDAEAKKGSKARTSLSFEPSAPGFSGEWSSAAASARTDGRSPSTEQLNKKRSTKRDRKIGSDFAQPNGDAAMYHVDTGPEGKFYAVAKETKK